MALHRFDSMELDEKAPRPTLREVSRHRLLEEMVCEVLKHGQLEKPEEPSAEPLPKYVVFLVDDETHRLVTTVCQVHDLVEQGVCLVENVNSERKALPVLDALYFLMPTEHNIEKILEDAASGEKKRCKYRNMHVFFTHNLPDNLLGKLQRHKRASSRIRSFAEVNLSFIAHDERIFHFEDEAMFGHVLDNTATPELIATADRLATVCASLGALDCTIRYAKSTDSNNNAEHLASMLKQRLDQIINKGPLFDTEKPDGDSLVIIIDRTQDWPAMLVHDLHYENAIYDLLGGGAANVKEKSLKYMDRGAEKVYNLADENEQLFAQWRHRPVWEANESTVQEVKRWAQRDDEMKSRTAHATSSSSMASMASNAMNALQSLPEHKDRFAKLQVHSDICHQCFKYIEDQKLIDVGGFEQDLLTGIEEASGKDMSSRKVEKELDNFLADPDISAEVKYRIVLLYIASTEEGARDEDKRQGFARRLRRDEKEAALSPLWINTAIRPPETAEQLYKRRAFYREQEKGRNQSPRSSKLRRWRPKVQDILEQATAGELSTVTFPELGKEDAPQPKRGRQAPTSDPPVQVILFILGGMTMMEGRVAHDTTKASGVDVFIGGNTIVTPDTLVGELVKRIQDAAAEAAATEAALNAEGDE